MAAPMLDDREREISGRAIATFVYSLLSISVPVIFTIVALVSANRAERQIQESGGRLRGQQLVDAARRIAKTWLIFVLVMMVVGLAWLVLVVVAVNSSSDSASRAFVTGRTTTTENIVGTDEVDGGFVPPVDAPVDLKEEAGRPASAAPCVATTLEDIAATAGAIDPAEVSPSEVRCFGGFALVMFTSGEEYGYAWFRDTAGTWSFLGMDVDYHDLGVPDDVANEMQST